MTVEEFSGSEVGSLNLAYPKNWRGPYLRENPVFQGKLYDIVKTKEGVFVIPGKGAKLPNNLVLGKDFKITFQSSIVQMIKEGGELNYNGQPLAMQLKFKIGDWGKEKMTAEEIEEIKSILEEFNRAMPFTQNRTVPYRC